MGKQWLQNLLVYYLYVLIVFIPFSVRYIWEKPFAISYLNIFSLGFIGLWIIAAIFRVIKFELPRNRLYFILLTVYLAGMLWAAFVTPNWRDCVGLWTSRLGQPLLVGFGVWLCLQNGLVSIRKILFAFAVALAGLTVVAWMQILGIIDSSNTTRITSIYDWPNTFARIQAYLLLLTIPLLGKNKFRLAFLGAWILGFIALLTSKSYNGVATFVIGVLIIFFLSKINSKLKILVLSVSLLAALVIAAFPAKIVPEWEIRINDSRNSRIEFWLIAQQVFREKPFTGLGIKGWENNYSQLAGRYKFYWPPLNPISAQPHNLILDALMKGGLPTLLAVLAFMSWPVIAGMRLVRQKPAIGLAILGASTMLFLFGGIDDPIWSDDMMPLIFITQAIALYALSKGNFEIKDEGSPTGDP